MQEIRRTTQQHGRLSLNSKMLTEMKTTLSDWPWLQLLHPKYRYVNYNVSFSLSATILPVARIAVLFNQIILRVAIIWPKGSVQQSK
jgi:hypothetical protein